MKNKISKIKKIFAGALLLCLAFSLLTCFASCKEEEKKDGGANFITGVYQTESQTGSFVRYTFTKDMTYECEVYTLDVLTAERKGTYELSEGEISLLREGDKEPDVFPFELKPEGVVINGNLYVKVA